MTRPNQSRRKWLDSLKVGDEVAIVNEVCPNSLAVVERRTGNKIIANNTAYSARTGIAFGSEWIWIPQIEPITDEMRAKLRHAELYRSVMGQMNRGVRTNVLEMIKLVLLWKDSPDVIVHAYDAILGLTRERMETQR